MSTFVKPPDLEQITLAKSSDINAITAATKAAFDLLPDENDLKTGAINYAKTSGGVANAYVVTMKDATIDYAVDGVQLVFKPIATNTGAANITVNTTLTKSIVLPTGQSISANDISVNAPVSLRYSSDILGGNDGAFVIDPNSSNYATIATTQAGIATTKADSAALSESNALTYKNNASSSANAAASSATTAQDWATKLTPVSGSDYGAKKYAIDASAAAGSASTSASNASDSLTDTIGNALEASNWAKLTNALVPIYNESTNSTSTSGSDYSAKEYAIGTTVESAKRHASGTTATGSAKDWAVKTVGEVVTGQGYSAFYYAGLASGSATTANTAAGSATTKANEAAASATSAANYAAALTATSTTSTLIGTGAKTFTTQANKQFQAGQTLKIVSQANSANFMIGTVTSYSTTSLVMGINSIGGSGTFSDWNISITGERGTAGLTGGVSLGASTDITGLVKGGSGVLSAAVPGTDYPPINNPTFTGDISDPRGDIRKLSVISKTTGFSLALTENKYVVSAESTCTAITVPNALFSIGDNVTIINNKDTAITLTIGSGLVAYISGITTAKTTITVEPRGVCSLLFLSSSLVYVNGLVS